MNRKQRRARDRKLKKAGIDNNEMEAKLGLFSMIPENCMVCNFPFDKTDKKMVSTWNVVVREKEKIVRVYCPSCWSKAQDLLSELGIPTNEEQNKTED